jgi:MarR-like DNA-binding transcriptional regulator SgrR of sgrS sRNA
VKNGIWIPDEIWQLKGWPPLHRILLAKVAALSANQRCSAGDERLAEYCTCTPQHIRKMTTELRDAGCLEVHGRGHTRSLAKATTVAKQPQLQTLQPQAQKKQPQLLNLATTVAKTIERL